MPTAYIQDGSRDSLSLEDSAGDAVYLCLYLLSGSTVQTKGTVNSSGRKGLLASVLLPGAKSNGCSFSSVSLAGGKGTPIHAGDFAFESSVWTKEHFHLFMP